MFNIKELQLLRTLIDNSNHIIKGDSFKDKVKKIDNSQSSEILYEEIRSHVSDLIILRKAWNKGNCIEEECRELPD